MLASCCAGFRSRQPCAGRSDTAAAEPTSEVAGSLDTIPEIDWRKAAAKDKAFYRDMSDKNSGQSLQHHLQVRHEKWIHRSSSLCIVVSQLGSIMVKQSTYGAAFGSDAANASRIGSLLNQISAELQISVRSLNAQGQEAHEAIGAQRGQVCKLTIPASHFVTECARPGGS